MLASRSSREGPRTEGRRKQQAVQRRPGRAGVAGGSPVIPGRSLSRGSARWRRWAPRRTRPIFGRSGRRRDCRYAHEPTVGPGDVGRLGYPACRSGGASVPGGSSRSRTGGRAGATPGSSSSGPGRVEQQLAERRATAIAILLVRRGRTTAWRGGCGPSGRRFASTVAMVGELWRCEPVVEPSLRRAWSLVTTRMPGSPGALLRRGPLRTGHAIFTAPGSSKPF